MSYDEVIDYLRDRAMQTVEGRIQNENAGRSKGSTGRFGFGTIGTLENSTFSNRLTMDSFRKIY
jgi:L-amino acid N-acyltransferase YncA